MASKPVYKVIFINQGQVYEIFACAIYQSEMYGFIEVEEFVFGERTQVVVDPSEEKLKNEFAGVKRSYIPMHAIIRIDEVEKRRRGHNQRVQRQQSRSVSLREFWPQARLRFLILKPCNGLCNERSL